MQVICSYVLMPLAYIMGVEWKDAGAVARLIGIKTFLNEFVAYDSLATMIKERNACLSGSFLSVCLLDCSLQKKNIKKR